MIPLADPAREHARLQGAIESEVLRVLRGGHYILGPEVAQFEQAFATYCAMKHCVGVSNGSDSIVVILQALGVGPGDEVITTALSYFATASTIVRTGATPVFADIDPLTFNLDPSEVAKKITAKTKAVLAVHLFGRAADFTGLRAALGARTDIALIEDSAQGTGCEHAGVRSGSMGTAASYSFFPAKPFGAAGDGGACGTNDEALAATMKRVRVTGASAKNVHDSPGGNYRLDPLQAAVLLAKLPHLEERLARRRSNAALLRGGLSDLSEQLVLPTEDSRGRHVYAQFVVRHPKREALKSALAARGVASEVYYPIPMPLQPVLSALGAKAGDYPHAERASREVLAIPTHSELEAAELSTVISATRDAVREVEGR